MKEQEALSAIHGFLRELTLADEIAAFQLLRNSGDPAKVELPPFQALIEFQNGAQFSSAFSAPATRGIHTGLPGIVMELVSDLLVRFLSSLPPPSNA